MDKGTPREQVGRVYVGLCELLYAPWRHEHITPGQEEAFRAAVVACLEIRGRMEEEAATETGGREKAPPKKKPVGASPQLMRALDSLLGDKEPQAAGEGAD